MKTGDKTALHIDSIAFFLYAAILEQFSGSERDFVM
jgi:hypothetical protein